MRLHFAEYMHNSFKQRNVVVQPGPLTEPPEARSMKSPSFRMIDFGRTESFVQYRDEVLYDLERDESRGYELDPEQDASIGKSWGDRLIRERWSARREMHFGKYENL